MRTAIHNLLDALLQGWLADDDGQVISETTDDEPALRRAYLEQRRHLHAQRVPLAYTVFLFFGAFSTGLEFIAYPGRRRIMLVAFAAYALTCISAIALVRARPAWTTAAAVVSNNLLILCLLAYYVFADGTPETYVMTLVLFLAAVSLLNAAGPGVQALTCISALISGPIVLLAAGDPHMPVAYDLTAIAGATAVTVLGAYLLDRQRHVAFRRREALRGSEERLRRVSERYRALYDHNPAMYFTVDAEGIVRSVNRFGAEYLGYRVEDLVGQPVTAVIYPADRDEFRSLLERCTERLGEVVHWEFRKLRQDGDVLWVKEAARGVRDPDGQLEVFIVCDDVTKRRQVEEAARRHQAELAHVARVSLLGEMAASLAHEIHQPLAAIVNFTRGCEERLRARGGVDAHTLDALGQASAQALRAGEILRRIRSFIRKEEPALAWVDINELVRNVSHLAEPDARQHNLQVNLAMSAGLPKVQANAIQIEQVLLNLVRNGFEAMSDTTLAERTLSIATGTPDGTCVEVAVSDTGTGLSAESLERLFDPFYSTKPTGLGLGLSISRSIIEFHGGRLWAERNPGAGSTFRFQLKNGGGDS